MKELKSTAWIEFCRRLNEFARDSALTIRSLLPDGSSSEVARDVTLRRVDYRKDECNDVIDIRTSGPAHTVTEPIRIRLEETEEGAAYNSVIIDAESGSTSVSFKPVLRVEWLSGLQVA
jgi:hypothetical protein